MSALLPDVYTLLHTPAVTALVGDRIFRHGDAPQDVAAPYITWFAVYAQPLNALNGTPPADNDLIQVDCWSENTGNGKLTIAALGVAVRDAIEARFHMEGVIADGKDYDTQRLRIGVQYRHWHHRT